MLALTVDVEEPYSKLIYGTNRLLDFFDSLELKATFFVIGEVVEKYPTLVHEISKRGHEIGFHGYKHVPLSKLNKEALAVELTYWKSCIEEITQKQVYGYRAPYFSLVYKTKWAFEVISDAGYLYDSSVYPGLTFNHCWLGAPTQPVKVKNTNLMMFPVPIFNYFLPIAFSGGGYLALLPKKFIKIGLKINYFLNKTGMIYVHPWQIEQASVGKIISGDRTISIRDKILNGFGRDKIDRRLCLAINEWNGPIGSMWEILNALKNIPEWKP